MTYNLDFAIKYKSDDEKYYSGMCVSAPKSCKNHTFINLEPEIKTKFNLHFDTHFVSCSYEGECCGHFGFLNLNLLVSNGYF